MERGSDILLEFPAFPRNTALTCHTNICYLFCTTSLRKLEFVLRMSRAADVLFESSILILGRISQADILMYVLLHSQDNIALHSFVSCEQNRKKGKYFDHVTKMSHMKKYDEKVCSKGHKHENLIFVSQII